MACREGVGIHYLFMSYFHIFVDLIDEADYNVSAFLSMNCIYIVRVVI